MAYNAKCRKCGKPISDIEYLMNDVNSLCFDCHYVWLKEKSK